MSVQYKDATLKQHQIPLDSILHKRPLRNNSSKLTHGSICFIGQLCLCDTERNWVINKELKQRGHQRKLQVSEGPYKTRSENGRIQYLLLFLCSISNKSQGKNDEISSKKQTQSLLLRAGLKPSFFDKA